MSRSWLIAAMFIVIAAPAVADDARHPVQATSSAAPAPNAETNDVDFEQHMQKMQALMDKMRATQDPQERQQLMQEHAQLMQEGMQMEQQAMANCPMMGEGGMDMMQMMMNHMRQREGMMGQGMMGGDMAGHGMMHSGAGAE